MALRTENLNGDQRGKERESFSRTTTALQSDRWPSNGCLNRLRYKSVFKENHHLESFLLIETIQNWSRKAIKRYPLRSFLIEFGFSKFRLLKYALKSLDRWLSDSEPELLSLEPLIEGFRSLALPCQQVVRSAWNCLIMRGLMQKKATR